MSISAITDRRVHIQPSDVHNVLSRHMLADGYDVVMDLSRSKGSLLFDARRGRAVLDFFTNFASCPIGYNHPRLDNPEFRERIATAAINKPGYPLSLTNTDPKKTQYFPKFDWPRIDNPKLRFPLDEDVEQREAATIDQAKRFLAERKDDVAAFIMEPIQGEGGDNHFRPEFF